MADPAPHAENDRHDDILQRVLDTERGPQMQAESTGSPVCPSCERRPPLERFPRYQVVTYEPLRYCPFCHGFWARGDSLARGVADPYSQHPALRHMPVTACKACGKRLDENLNCTKCDWVAPALDCPSCREPMHRVKTGGVVLDICGSCEGIWFETGEINALYGLSNRPASLIATMFPQASECDGLEGIDVADIIALAITFLPLP
jgi:Zn-finger nucleic acid-binding protein